MQSYNLACGFLLSPKAVGWIRYKFDGTWIWPRLSVCVCVGGGGGGAGSIVLTWENLNTAERISISRIGQPTLTGHPTELKWEIIWTCTGRWAGYLPYLGSPSPCKYLHHPTTATLGLASYWPDLFLFRRNRKPVTVISCYLCAQYTLRNNAEQ